MSRNSSKSTNVTIEAETPKVIRTRTRLNTLIVYRQSLDNGQAYFVALHNSSVSAAFAYDESENLLVLIPDTMGAYDGMKSYVRSMRTSLTPILVTKSIDADVVASQADKYVVQSFLQNYIDRLTVKRDTENAAIAVSGYAQLTGQ